MWYVGFVKSDESLLNTNRPDHDMIKGQDITNVENKVIKRS